MWKVYLGGKSLTCAIIFQRLPFQKQMCRMWKVYLGKEPDSFASSRLNASTSRQGKEIVWNKFQDFKNKIHMFEIFLKILAKSAR